MIHTNHIKYRYYIKGMMELLSPLIIASGEMDLADIQCVRDWDRNLIIPATSLAGNLRHFLEERLNDHTLIRKYFGFRDDKSNHSCFIFYDCMLQSRENVNNRTVIRDGVALENWTKTAKDQSKYDYELIETSSKFDFRMEILVRDKEQRNYEEIEAIASKMIESLEQGEIRLGAKTSRGFGKIRLTDTKLMKLDMEEEVGRNKWIDFDWNQMTGKETIHNYNQMFKKTNDFSLSVRFSIPDSFIIKSYSSNPEDVDSVSLSSNGKQIIPGTSWTGAIRHSLVNIGRSLDKKKEMELLLKKLFGDVQEPDRSRGTKAKAIPSKIFIDESIIKDARKQVYTRNKVDRFTGGVVNSALFDEEPLFDGTVDLNCGIKDAEDYEKGLLLLAVMELQNGIQTVGGGSNIGRGRLEKKDEIFLPQEEKEKYLNALAEKLNTMGGCHD